MDFPYFGDAAVYQALGESCARFLQGFPDASCFSSIRPVGIAFYFAIPYLISSDKVVAAYLTLAMNLILLAIVAFAFLRIVFSDLYDFLKSKSQMLSPKVQMAFLWISVAGVILISLPHIPIRLSDFPATAIFIISFAFIASNRSRMSPLNWALAGGFMGFSVLLKQYFLVAGGIALVISVSLWGWQKIRGKELFARGFQVTLLGLGFIVVSGVQVLWMRINSGIIGFYDEKWFDDAKAITIQPFVELIAWSSPKDGSTLTRLPVVVDPIRFFLVKFREGIANFDVFVYAGLPQRSETVSLSVVSLSLTAVALTAMLLMTWYLFHFRLYPFAVLYSSILFTTLFATYRDHVENRYFMPLRFVLFGAILILAVRLVTALRYKGNLKNGNMIQTISEEHSNKAESIR